ncbi:MAG: hypothetical protein ABFS35_16870 [Bacteroidota bacterium]
MKRQLILLAGILMSITIFAQDSKLKVSPDEIKIPINTQIFISTKLNGSKIGDFKLLDQSKIKKPIDMMEAFDKIEKKDIVSNEMEFKFCHADFMGSKIVVLTTVHHLLKSMTFKAKIKIKGRNKHIETSIVTKHPNVFSIEQWQDDIESIILYDFEIVEE